MYVHNICLTCIIYVCSVHMCLHLHRSAEKRCFGVDICLYTYFHMYTYVHIPYFHMYTYFRCKYVYMDISYVYIYICIWISRYILCIHQPSLLHLQGRCGAFLVAKRGKVSCSVHSCLSVCCRPPPPLWSSCFSRSPPFYRNAPPVLSYICIFTTGVTSRYLDPSTGLSMIYLFVHKSAQIMHVCTWISIYMFACKYLSKFRISVVAICI